MNKFGIDAIIEDHNKVHPQAAEDKVMMRRGVSHDDLNNNAAGATEGASITIACNIQEVSSNPPLSAQSETKTRPSSSSQLNVFHERTLSDSVLTNYKNSQSNNHTLGGNSHFRLAQRSAAMKQEILVSMSKITECINMMREFTRHNSQQQQQQQPQQAATQVENENTVLIELWVSQVRQNISKMSLYVDDDYYRIVISNHNGIEILLSAMNTFQSCENICATCNISLWKICRNNNQTLQWKVINADGFSTILSSIVDHPQSPKVCSAAVDALFQVTSENDDAILMLKGLHIEKILSGVEFVLYPLSKLNLYTILSKLR
jgi:hypothetical protein